MTSELKQKLSAQMKQAMKEKDQQTLGFARNLHAAIRQKEIDDKIEMDDQQFQQVVNKLAKQRQDSVEQYEKGGRSDLVENEKAELAFLKQFLPQPLSQEELEGIVDEAINEAQPQSSKEMGRL